MTIKLIIKQKTKQVLLQIQNHQRLVPEAIEEALYTCGAIAKREIIRLIQDTNKTGRIYGNHQASAPGEAPANETGKLAASVDYKVSNPFEMELGERAPYAGFLEDGTRNRNMAARPHLITAVNNTARAVQVELLEAVKKKL